MNHCNMGLKMSYSLSHTVDKQMGGWWGRKKKNNRNNFSRSVANGKQTKHQTPYHTIVNYHTEVSVSSMYF
jgi:hypothetical protein